MRSGETEIDMTPRRTLLGGGLALAALAGCRDAPPSTRFAELTYAHRSPLRVDAGRLEIVDEYVAPLAPPHVEHLAPAQPATVLRRWASDRIVAAGSPERIARFVIRDARITETALPRPGGLRGQVTTSQSERYECAIAAALEIRSQRGDFREGFAEARASRARTVAEDITLADRDRALYELVEQTMIDFDAELERQIRSAMPLLLLG